MTRWLVAAVCCGLALSACGAPATATRAPAPNTEPVRRGALAALVSGAGTLTYRARPDGSPFVAVNHATGVYTHLPEAGDEVGCGHVLYRVDNRPVVLLCGTVPAFRDLRTGVRGPDVAQLNRALHVRGELFTAQTGRAVQTLQRRSGLPVSGALPLGTVVFAPAAVRVARVAGQLGGPAQPGAPVLTATSDTLQVRVDLDASDQGQVHRGDRVQVILPGNTPVAGRVAGFGRVAQAQPGAQATAATIPTFIRLDHPDRARGLDQAPVGVDITTKGVADALSVPVTALVGRAGGGFAVEVVHGGERRDLVPVRIGLFDTGGGRVQVEGDLREGDRVAVPSI